MAKVESALHNEHEQWRDSIHQKELSQYCDCKQAYINEKDRAFINLGNVSTEDRLSYFSPAKIYRVKPMQSSFRLSVPQQQMKAQLRSMDVAFNNSDHTEYSRDLSFAAIDRVMPNSYNGNNSEEEEEDSGDDNADDDVEVALKGTTGAAEEQVHNFDFGYAQYPINIKDHPIISKLTYEKDTADRGTVNTLIWELLSLPHTNNHTATFEFANEC
jgi:hypothetical protein